MDPFSLAAIGVPALLKLFGGGGGNSNAQPALSADQQQMLSDLLNLQYQRLVRTDPLHQAAVAMATRLAPTYARAAMGPTPQRHPGSGPPTRSNPTTDALATMTGNYQTGNPGTALTPRGIVYIGGRPYMVPGGGAGPVTGPEDPDPMHHPAGSSAGRPVSDSMSAFFFGNPYGAFTGSGLNGGGEQRWNGMGHAR